MSPIAIVGRACVLPGALSPQALWRAVLDGRDLTTAAPSGRWGLPRERALATTDATLPDRAWSDRGGYVEGFERIWQPQGFALPAAELDGLDTSVHWLLHCSRAALAPVQGRHLGTRVGAVFGSLGFPSAGMAAFADQVWRGGNAADARNRYMSGGSAALLARALALDAGCHAIDAACASSLYAIKLACDRLSEGSADWMLAGAVQGADDLFLHIGFSALNALSRSGQSRPFHRDADGLLPAEGCAMLALKRLDDARRDGDTIYALIRGIGLSNDGRGKGLLVPDEAGQERAIRSAWSNAGLAPSCVSLLECHATGTPVGDATELRSSAAALAGVDALPVGSLKANLGHLITAAGAAGVIKLIEAMRAGVLPPGRAVDSPTLALAATPFVLLPEAKTWHSAGPRVAAISAFGFGGNNAHLILSEDDARLGSVATAQPKPPLAIVGVGVIAGSAANRAQFTAALFAAASLRDPKGAGAIEKITLDLAGLRFPPKDLQQSLPQQLAILNAARAALAECAPLPHERSMVLIGIEPDAEVARFGTRWRLPVAAGKAAQDAVIGPLQAAGVIGCMPNIPANRLSAQFDLAGPAFTVQAGAASGLYALHIAAGALGRGEIDAAIVGAVDFCCEPVTRAAGNTDPADASVALVLKRLSDAERDGDRIYAEIRCGDLQKRIADHSDIHADLSKRLGDAGAANDLLKLCAGALSLHHRRRAGGRPWLTADPRTLEFALPGVAQFTLQEAIKHPRRSDEAGPQLRVYSGANKSEVIAALTRNQPSNEGPARLVLVATDATLETVTARALAHLTHGAPAGNAVHFRTAPITGETAFVFAGAGAAYPGMGKELLSTLPQLLDHLALRSRRLTTALEWAFDPDAAAPSPLQQLWGASALSQLHLALTEQLLGLRADAWLGYSSGETNALVGAGVWRDPDALMQQMEDSGLITHQLGGDFAAVRAIWQCEVHWASYTVLAPINDVRAALAGVARVHLAIINSDADCLIAGDESACATVVQKIGAQRCVRLIYPLAVHVPELAMVEAQWLALHRRETHSPRHGRIYATALGSAYAPNTEACARAILQQANQTLDLRPVVMQAWRDGVRVFIEHGPGGTLGRAIGHILGEREALVVSLDRKGQGIDATLGALAALVAAGLKINLQLLNDLLASATPVATPTQPMDVPGHWPAVVLSEATMATPLQIMAPAPQLPPTRRARLNPSALPQQLPLPAAPNARATLPLKRAQLAQLAQAQQLFMETQNTLHLQFLKLSATAQQQLFAARYAGTIAPPRAATSSASRPGPKFDRAQLQIHADGKISELFGAAFAPQDAYLQQVRMPKPPLLLADRVSGIEGEPGSMGRGRIWTHTEVAQHPDFLHHDTLAAGVLIEAGQADLMLISWLGVDRLNQGERVYRLLGCELTYHGDLPRRGDTLDFEIEIEGHATQGDVRLMFFNYACHNATRPQLSVQKGQAGFFTAAELAASLGCLWQPETQAIVPQPTLDPPVARCAFSQLDRRQLEAFAAGDLRTSFGPEFARAATHRQSPGIPTGRMLLLDRISALAFEGGPWRRGYLRAELDISPQQWFFDGHFKNDPCMPGTLMFEACLQAMAVYIAARGDTLMRDGWRFQPVPEQPYQLQCRGQVTPRSRLLVTEVFVEECSAGPIPTVFADLLCTVDGLKAFHARRVGLQLVPDWPLPEANDADPNAARETAQVGGFRFDRQSLLACASGRPSQAFGPMYQRFDGPQRVARLPCPPYFFISRIQSVHGAIGVMRAGAAVIAEYDVPASEWYFDHNGCRRMPFAVLLEAALQPCGWLSSYVGSALTSDSELSFRNLDGTGTVLAELCPDAGILRTEVTLSKVSASAGMIIENFEVRCWLDQTEVYRLHTVFGFFPPAALAAQAGLPTREDQRELLLRPANEQIDLSAAPAQFFAAIGLRLPAPMLRMIDRIEGIWPNAGAAGLGQLRAVKDVNVDEWFFKAHFFQDPVQPGSLGLEAMLQCLQAYLIYQGAGSTVNAPRFETIALGATHQWKYRGQVLPHHESVHTTLEITARGEDARGIYAFANASLWADGQRIYEATGIGVRIVAAESSQ